MSRPTQFALWIYAKYEKLQYYCHTCGRIGHEAKGCMLAAGSDPFGPGYGVTPVKVMADIVQASNIGSYSVPKGGGNRVRKMHAQSEDVLMADSMNTGMGSNGSGRNDFDQSSDTWHNRNFTNDLCGHVQDSKGSCDPGGETD